MIAIVKQSASLRRFLAEHPLCCYCGGPAETKDHVPSTQMFDGRHRPKGLEVPACDACNQATKKHEQIVAFIARFVSPTSPALTREQTREFDVLLERVRKHSPLLLSEIATPSWQQQHDFRKLGPQFANTGPLNVGGPLVSASMSVFAKKLAHALYYAHAGRVIPPTGGVFHQIITNHVRHTGGIPQTMFEGLSDPQTLRQGEFNVSNQFEYLYGVGDRFGTFIATFRTAFMVHMVVHEDRDALQQLGPSIPIAAPGVR